SIMKDTPGLNERIAERVRALRAAGRLSLDALARRSGVSRSMISLIERGETSPTAVVLDKLAAGLGVLLPSLFEGSEAKAGGPARRARRRRPARAPRRPAAVARSGVGLRPSQRLADWRAAADADRRGALPARTARRLREPRPRSAHPPAGVGAGGLDRRDAR